MIKTTIFSIVAILSLAILACTQKSFDVAPGQTQPPSNANVNQPNGVPTNPHPLFVEEFYFNAQPNAKNTKASSSETLAPNSTTNENN
ncbi:hypothetical protein L3V82_02245 [Thiotrichales bacterium 19S3-7]|nr:hypothetical protein [Thiotrichales bacterium 19S3-7]MCF6800987.1 hypothetical protein [Thiotrichales bacterium 19S3-11]